MIWLLLILLVVLAGWVAIGALLLVLGSRSGRNDYQRSVEGRIFSVKGSVNVTLRLTAPALMKLADDHDVILTLDHSSSMGGGPGSPLREAIRAAENFIHRLPDNIHIGIVSFDHEARVLCPLTNDHRRVLRSIAGINSGGGTSIHDALQCSLEAVKVGRADVRKTIILLSDGGSDRNLGLAAANHVYEDAANISVICIGFGAHVDEELLRGIARDDGKYIRVDDQADLDPLFRFLAGVISGQMAVAGLVDEGIHSPHPFRLLKTGGLYPIGVQPADPTRIVWSIPLLDAKPVALTYKLSPECPGWHRVATADSKAHWRMPDGSQIPHLGLNGPSVLVLPGWLTWSWPILNPLFWMIFGRFWPCVIAPRRVEPAPDESPLPITSLPSLLQPPQDRLYALRIKPALVIGLGETGEWTICRLKDRLRDRDVEEDLVQFLAVYAQHQVNRPRPLNWLGVKLKPNEQIELHYDLWPYLESLRRVGASEMRNWIPWREWLANIQPLTTARGIAQDRRKARLVALQTPERLEEFLRKAIPRLVEQDGMVVLVGAAGEAECSGLLAEVAHICAAEGIGTTAVLTPDPSDSVLALAQELERMVLMSSKHIVSDRHTPSVSARKLFDRIIVAEGQRNPEQSSLSVSELIWDFLAYDQVLSRLPLLPNEGNQVLASRVRINGRSLPAAKLWHWVRERTLAIGINGQRMGLREEKGKLVLPPVDPQLIQTLLQSFWSGQNATRPQPRILNNSQALISESGGNPVSALLELQDELPSDSPYHEQVEYTARQRTTFARYLEEWCAQILERERGREGWTLPELLTALLRLESDFETIVQHMSRLSGNADFAIIVNFASSLFADFLTIVTSLTRGLEGWLAHLVGRQASDEVLGDTAESLCHQIERGRQTAETQLLEHTPSAISALDEKFSEWFRSYGDNVLGQWRFGIALINQRLTIQLRYQDKEVTTQEDLAARLRSALDDYKNTVLTWPMDRWLSPESISQPDNRLRVGLHSKRAYPNVERVIEEEDPFTVTALAVEMRPLKDALDVVATPAVDLPYAWPEEANAKRLAEKIRNRCNYNPHDFSTLAVHLMRDTQKLKAFIDDLAQGRIATKSSRFILSRDADQYEVGPTNENLQGLDVFEEVAKQVVSLEVSVDGKTLPLPTMKPSLGLEATIAAIEAHPLGKEAANSPSWKMWKDVIRGLILEHG